ncbi:4Fe-4S dicluster domain-containing protein [Eubacterium sp.]|uniref:4Fe-4S dicluster domain-containing protein n=1 Tax=Eubacterium sp. TaxID=142586 RepID=UPI0025CCF152|nr:4Fe-4S dicluster domain-containing protein [uncultured Eubacterium sp.]MDD5837881.1 4Fe-4S binding protein [Eubacteriales bacterium]
MKSDLKKLGLKCSWEDLTEGMQIYGSMTSKEFKTGEWATVKPTLDSEKCINCLLCIPVCPDSCIATYEGTQIRGPIDYDHCKGCGICAKTCPTGALTMKGVK